MTYPPKMKAFPIEWPAMKKWRMAYRLTGGKGFTGCSIVSPDLQTEYGSTGSAMVWELFESTAYDRKKFQAMIDQSLLFAKEEQSIRESESYGKRLKLAKFKSKIARETRSHVRLPPNGFSAEKAKELFKMTGDLPGESNKAPK